MASLAALLAEEPAHSCFDNLAVVIDEQDERLCLAGQRREHVHHFLGLGRAVLIVEAGGGRQRVDDDQRQFAIEILLEALGGLLRERLQPREGSLLGEAWHAARLPGEWLTIGCIAASRGDRRLDSHLDLALAFRSQPQDATIPLTGFRRIRRRP